MREIYGRASQVIVNLGQAADSSDMLPELVQSVFHANKKLEDEARTGTGSTVDAGYQKIPVERFTDLSLPAVSSPLWNSFAHLLRRPWFHRVWVIQEAVVGQEVTFTCGNWQIPWITLLEALQICAKRVLPILGNAREFTSDETWKDQRGAHNLGLIAYCKELRERDPSSKSLALDNLLHHCRSLEATDPRDRVFAVLGLSLEADDKGLEPNYAESAQDVHVRYARHFIQRGSGPGVLFNSFLSGSSQYELPSWVPDWSANPYNFESLLGNEDIMPNQNRKYSAAGTSSPIISISISNNALAVHAILFDTISHLGIHPISENSRSYRQRLANIAVSVSDLRSFLSRSECSSPYALGDREETVWRTLIYNKAVRY
jgi:hypothetical protein